MVADLLKTDVPSAPPGIQKSSALGPSSPASPFTEDDFENHVCIPLSHRGEVEAMLYFREGVFRLDPIRLHESQGKFHLKKKKASLAVWLQNPPLVSLAQFPRFFALSCPHVHQFSFCSSCNCKVCQYLVFMHSHNVVIHALFGFMQSMKFIHFWFSCNLSLCFCCRMRNVPNDLFVVGFHAFLLCVYSCIIWIHGFNRIDECLCFMHFQSMLVLSNAQCASRSLRLWCPFIITG